MQPIINGIHSVIRQLRMKKTLRLLTQKAEITDRY